ncbi:MAG: efflux RND transporter periplasmic adaptor subunit [Phycisphaeraceae bacterium]|nr:efflux RND transporter periplasmic adaptor subunit [Phycisphaerales bacterium]MCB9859581.1 efflux RND transporter periplasmic adaptor subunit [Phycisphaeraceae bacterium]
MTQSQPETTPASGSQIARTQHAPAPLRGGSARADRFAAFLSDLLRFQCATVGSLGGVIYLLPTPQRAGGIAARAVTPGVPADLATSLDNALQTESPLRARLIDIARAASTEGNDISTGVVERVALPARATGLYQNTDTAHAIACPLVAGGKREGTVVLLLPQDVRDPNAALRLLQLTCARFETYVWQQQALGETEHKLKLRETLELLDTANQGRDTSSMGALMCEEIRRRFGCTRVSIGLVRNDRMRMVAVSGSDDVDRHAAAAEAIELTMEECADQDAEIAYPVPEEVEHDPSQRRITRAAERLSLSFGPSAVLSLPLRVEGDLIGVMVLEREARDPFPAGAIPLLRLVAEFVGPALWTRRLADRGIAAVARDRTTELMRAAVGPRHTIAKIIATTALLAAVVLALPIVPKRVPAKTEIAPSVSRTIVPPFVGHLADVLVSPGDRVEAGQVIAHMDVADLESERTQLESRLAGAQTDLEASRSDRNFARERVVSSEINEMRANLARTQLMLDRAEIVSPISGVVARGDLEPYVGARVEPTQPLMEIVQEQISADMRVDERQINSVRVGQHAALTVKARPGSRVELVITKMRPIAEPANGANMYLLEAEPVDPPDWLLPGMSGTSKVRVTDENDRTVRTNGWSILVGPLIDRARMWLWW